MSSNDNGGLPTLFVVVFFSWYILSIFTKLAWCAFSFVSCFRGLPLGCFSIPNYSNFFWWYSLACSIPFNPYSSSVLYLCLRHSLCFFIVSGDGLFLYFLGLNISINLFLSSPVKPLLTIFSTESSDLIFVIFVFIYRLNTFFKWKLIN